MANYPHIAGTASSLLGLARFAFGGVTAPLVGLGGTDNALPLGLITMVSAVLGTIAYVTFMRPRATAATRVADGVAAPGTPIELSTP
jgi:DHA1 family bicyclomycin/chloramphenicol resistance-like MFS transporter